MNPNMGLVAQGFTRPADTTAYASGDLVANSTTAGSVVPMAFGDITRGPGLSSRVRRVRLVKSAASVTNASFRLHLFNVLPTVTSGDNAAIVIATGSAGYVGHVDITIAQTFTDGAADQATTEMNIASQAIWGLLEARGAYTPTSAEVFAVTLEVERY